jgi:hypothetical protein
MMTSSPLFFTLTLIGKALLFVLYCAVLGRASLGLIKKGTGDALVESTNEFLRLFFDICVGMAALTFVLFLLGLSSLLSLTACTLTLALLFMGAVVYLRRGPGTLWLKVPGASSFSGFNTAHFLVFFCLFVFVVLVAVQPPGHWDDTSYHLPYARHYVENHVIAVNPFLRFPLFPHNGNLLFSLGLMYGTDTDAQVLATLPLFVTSVGLFGACQLFIRSTSAAYLAVGVFLALGPIHDTLGYAYIDNLLALYAWAATLALAIWLRKPRDSNAWLIICGVLMGTAAGTKLFGAVLAVFVGLYLLLAVRQWRVVLIYACSTLFFGIGWYVRSFYISGDPVHPAGGNYFGHYLWNAADLLSQLQEQSTHGAVKNPFSIFSALQAAGISILIPALGVIAQTNGRRRSVLFLYIVFALYLSFWLLSAQVARYVAPVFALGSFLSVFFLYQAGLGLSLRQLKQYSGQRVLKWVSVLGVLACVLSLGNFAAKSVSVKLANWDASLAARSGYKVMGAANFLRPQYGDKLMQLGFENAIYFFKGTVIGDWFGPGRYANMILCAERCQLAPAEQIVALMRGFNAQMLAVNAKRFQFEPQQYQDLFEIKFQTNDEFLLVLKK